MHLNILHLFASIKMRDLSSAVNVLTNSLKIFHVLQLELKKCFGQFTTLSDKVLSKTGLFRRLFFVFAINGSELFALNCLY